MAAEHNAVEDVRTVNIEECFEAAREVATQAGNVKIINMLFSF